VDTFIRCRGVAVIASFRNAVMAINYDYVTAINFPCNGEKNQRDRYDTSAPRFILIESASEERAIDHALSRRATNIRYCNFSIPPNKSATSSVHLS